MGDDTCRRKGPGMLNYKVALAAAGAGGGRNLDVKIQGGTCINCLGQEREVLAAWKKPGCILELYSNVVVYGTHGPRQAGTQGVQSVVTACFLCCAGGRQCT